MLKIFVIRADLIPNSHKKDPNLEIKREEIPTGWGKSKNKEEKKRQKKYDMKEIEKYCWCNFDLRRYGLTESEVDPIWDELVKQIWGIEVEKEEGFNK